MKIANIFSLTFTIVLSLSSLQVIAQETTPNSNTAIVNNEMTNGEIRKIDKQAKKITIKHGEIKNLEMPPMTMVFQVKDEAFLDKVKAGDKVNFVAEKISGAFVLTQIQVTN